MMLVAEPDIQQGDRTAWLLVGVNRVSSSESSVTVTRVKPTDTPVLSFKGRLRVALSSGAIVMNGHCRVLDVSNTTRLINGIFCIQSRL